MGTSSDYLIRLLSKKQDDVHQLEVFLESVLLNNSSSSKKDVSTIQFISSMLSDGSQKELSFFTLSTEIWIVIERSSKKIIACQLFTTKRAYVGKLWGIITDDNINKSNICSLVARKLERFYYLKGLRKIYIEVDISELTYTAQIFMQLNYKIEAVLRNQENQEVEIVYGKILKQFKNKLAKVNPINLMPFPPADIKFYFGVTDNLKVDFLAFLLKNAPYYYDQVDEEACLKLIDMQAIPGKKNLVAVAKKENEIVACIVATIKNAAEIKVSPVLFDVNHKSFYIFKRLLKIILNAGEHIKPGKIKVYTLIPASEMFIWKNLLSLGWICEGIYQEGYKPGLDTIILAQNI